MNKNNFTKNSYTENVSQASTPSSSKSRKLQISSLSSDYRKKYYFNHSKNYSQGSPQNQQCFVIQKELQRSLLGKSSSRTIKALSQSLQIAKKKVSVLNEKYLHKSRISQNQQNRQSKISLIRLQKQKQKNYIQMVNNFENKRMQKIRKGIISQRINSYYKTKEQKTRKQFQRMLNFTQNRKNKIQIQSQINQRRKQIEKQRKNKYKKVCELQQAHKYKMQQFLIDKRKKFQQNKLIQRKNVIKQQQKLSKQLTKISKIQNSILLKKNSILLNKNSILLNKNSILMQGKTNIQTQMVIKEKTKKNKQFFKDKKIFSVLQRSYNVLNNKKYLQKKELHHRSEIKIQEPLSIKKISSSKQKQSNQTTVNKRDLSNTKSLTTNKHETSFMNNKTQKLKELIQKNIGNKTKENKRINYTDKVTKENQLILPKIKKQGINIQKQKQKKSYEKYKG